MSPITLFFSKMLKLLNFFIPEMTSSSKATQTRTKKIPKKTVKVDKVLAAKKRTVEQLKKRAEAFKIKSKKLSAEAKEISASLLNQKGVALRKTGPKVNDGEETS
jgi:guanyl-specific ribonuclease Sa